MPRREPLLGYLVGGGENAGARIAVYKAGRTFRLAQDGQTHLCHPSITSLSLCRREAAHVLGVFTESFEAL